MIDLTQFCDKENDCKQFDLGEPFVQDGFRCWANGWVCVRQPTKDNDTSGRRLPRSVADVFAEFSLCDEASFPGPFHFRMTCPECGESVTVYVPVKIGKAYYDGAMILRIARLPGVKHNAPDRPEDNLYFVADDGLQGVLCPIAAPRRRRRSGEVQNP